MRMDPDRTVRQVKGVHDKWGVAPAILLLTAVLYPAVSDFAQGAVPEPAKLHANTLEAFDHYVKLTETRNSEELKRGTNLLWIDELPAAERAEDYAALKRGEVKMKKLEMRDGGRDIACPAGLIHHWTGVVFIPGARLEDVIGMLEDYDKHSVYYGPDVERSKIESRDGDHFHVFLRFRRHKVITVVLNTEHDIEYFHDGPERAHSRSSAVRIAEMENAGKKDEREKPPGEDGGFLWRMETWWRMEERDGGVYVQSEVVSLTRDIPVVLKWLIEPFVTSVPKETLSATLLATRKAVQSRMAAERTKRAAHWGAALCPVPRGGTGRNCLSWTKAGNSGKRSGPCSRRPWAECQRQRDCCCCRTSRPWSGKNTERPSEHRRRDLGRSCARSPMCLE